jgi:beta-mannosidase
MISSNWYNTNQDKQLYSNDYRKLYVDTIRDTVLYTDKSRPYISSSPTNGKETESENWIATDPYDARWGDSHFYDYSIDGWDPARYPLSRFTSEFGFQSFPSYSLLESVYTSQADLTFPSQMNEHRQHHGDGNQQLVDQIQMHFNLFNFTNQSMFFDSVIYQTQINQAMSLKTAIEVFRRNRDFVNMTNGVGMCMGVMYWQLNDIWQAPTWSAFLVD